MKDLELKLVLRATDQGLVGTVQDAKTSTEDLSRALDSAAKHTKAADKGHEQLADSVKQTGQQAGQTESKVESLNRKLGKQRKRTEESKKESDGFTASLKSGAVKAGVWAAAITAAMAVAGGLATSLRTDAIRETQIMSETLGVSTAALSEWEYAAQSMNVSGEQVGDIFKDVSDKIGDFVTTGGGEAADLFENLNLKVGDLIDLSPDQQLEKIGVALDSVGNRGQKIFFLEALANDASKLLPLLENDAAELKRLQLEAQVLGVSLSDIDAAKVTAASRSFDRVGGLAKGLANDLTIELAPILGGVSDLLVDAAIEAGGFRGAIGTAIDYGVTGLGYVLDYLQQLRVMLKYSELGWGYIGQAATSALASVADGASKVINTVLYPFQQYISWMLDKFSDLIQLGAEFGGPFADEFQAASEAIKRFSTRVDSFKVSSEDIISLNKSMTVTVAQTRAELDQLLQEPANSHKLKDWLADVQERFEEQAQAQQKLGKASDKATGTVVKNTKKQKDVYADLVKELEAELSLIQLGERERAIQIQLRKLDANATEEQKQKITELVGTLYDYKARLKENEAAAKVWSDITDNAVQSVDDSFRELFRSGLRGWDDFWDQMLTTAKNMLAELAYTLVKEQLFVNVGFNVTGANGGGGFNPLSLLSSGAEMLGLGDGVTSFLAAPFGYAANFGAATAAGAGTQQAMMLAEQSAAFGAEGAALTSEALGGTGSLFNPAALGPAAFAAIFGTALTGILTTKDGPRLTFGQGDVGDEDITFSHTYTRTGKDVDIHGDGQVTDVYTERFGGYVDTEFGRFGAIDGGFTKKLDGEFRQYFDGVLLAVDQLDETISGYLSEDEIQKVTDSLSETFLPEGHKLGLPGREGTDPDDQLVARYSQIIKTALPNAFADALLDIEDISFEKLSKEMVTAFELIERSGESLGVSTSDLASLYEQNARDGETLNQTLSRMYTSVTTLQWATSITGNTFDLTGQSALTASEAITTAAGGLDALRAGVNVFYQEFYSEAERANLAFEGVSGQLAEMNVALPESREAFRLMVESIDLTTEAGQQQYALLMSLMGSIDQYYDHIEKQKASASSDQEDDAQRIAATQARRYQEIQERRIRAEQERYQQERNLLDQINGTLDNLALSNLSTLKPQERLQVAQSDYARLLVELEGGDYRRAGDLNALAQQYLSEAYSHYASSDAYQRIYSEVISSLELMRAQLEPRSRVHGSHRNGVDRVPFDGYQAELHADEMVLTAPVAQVVRDAAKRPVSRDSELSGEVQALRKEIQALRKLTAQIGTAQISEAREQTAELRRSRRRTRALMETV